MRKKKKRVEETGSKAQQFGFYSPHKQPSCFTDFIFKNFELICQGTYFRDGNEIFLVPFEVSLFKRGRDLLIRFNRFGVERYIARLHKTNQEGIYRFYYKDATFEIDFSNDITAVINKLHNILTVCNLVSCYSDEVSRCVNEFWGEMNETNS